jgi:hypothetical protein
MLCSIRPIQVQNLLFKDSSWLQDGGTFLDVGTNVGVFWVNLASFQFCGSTNFRQIGIRLRGWEPTLYSDSAK